MENHVTENDEASAETACLAQTHLKSLTEDETKETLQEEEGKLKQSKKCWCCKQCLNKLSQVLSTKHNPLSQNPTIKDRLCFSLLLPPHGRIGFLMTLLFVGALFFFTCWAMVGDAALPGGDLFGLLVLFCSCVVGGAFVNLVKLPPLLGMLLVGFMLRNWQAINVVKNIHPEVTLILRTIALVVILIRAGLGLDPVALRKLSRVVFTLAFLPCICECITVAVASHLLLDFPWSWGFMLGFVLAAVSPAVVVPSMLHLQVKGYGVEKGIPTLVIAAASIDDVLAISGFGIVLGITFSKGDLIFTIFKGPLVAIAGIAYGFVLGILLWYYPHKKHENKVLFRFLLLLLGSMLAMFGSRAIDFPGAGALGCLMLAFVAGLRWRKETPSSGQDPMQELFAKLWVVFQPLLFGLIGAEVDLAVIEPSTIGLGIAVLCIGLVIRMVASYIAVLKAGLNLKEKLFIPLAWLPKATVQAAIGSFALDNARATNAGKESIQLGLKVLTIAVLVILITAPLGAAAIALTGPRFLQHTLKSTDEIEVELEEDQSQVNIRESDKQDVNLEMEHCGNEVNTNSLDERTC